ncbi:MAG: ATP-binding protein [Verrucomicrobiia bacterium]
MTINRYVEISPARERKPHLMELSEANAALGRMAKGKLENVSEMACFFDVIKDLGQRVGPSVSVDKILRTVLDLACKLLRVDRGDFIGPDRRSGKLVCLAQWGPLPRKIREGDPLPSPGFINDLLRSGKNHAIAPNVHKLRHYHAGHKRTRSEIAFRFHTAQGRKFLLNLESFQPNFFNHEDVRLLALLLPYVEARVAQAEGRETLALYKDLIVDHLQEMVYVKDVEGRYVFVSRNFAAFLGVRSPRDVIGKKDQDFFKRHPEMVAAFLKLEQKVMKSGKSSGWFHELFEPDCQPLPWRINTIKAPVFASDSIADLMAMASGTEVSPVEANNGRKVVGVMGILHDASEESHLKQAQALARTGCIIWHKKTDRVDVTDSIWDIFAIPAKDRLRDPSAHVGAVLSRLLTKVEPEDQGKLLGAYSGLVDRVRMRAQRQGYERIPLETPIVFKLAGKERWLRLSYENSFEIHKDPESQVAMFVVHDVTELQNSIRELEETKARLMRGNQGLILGALSRATLHDAKQPIDLLPPSVDNIVSSLGELDKLPATRRAAQVQEVIETLQHLKQLSIAAWENIEHLRALSADPKSIRNEKIDLIKVLNQCRWAVGPTKYEMGIEIEMNPPPKLPKVLGDRIALQVGFGNLLRNAIGYGCPEKSDKRIKIAPHYDPFRKGVVVEIEDSGPGFPKEVIEHVREPYSVPINPRGMGFGLVIAKTLFSLMGGSMEVFPGRGARCQIYLPKFQKTNSRI